MSDQITFSLANATEEAIKKIGGELFEHIRAHMHEMDAKPTLIQGVTVQSFHYVPDKHTVVYLQHEGRLMDVTNNVPKDIHALLGRECDGLRQVSLRSIDFSTASKLEDALLVANTYIEEFDNIEKNPTKFAESLAQAAKQLIKKPEEQINYFGRSQIQQPLLRNADAIYILSAHTNIRRFDSKSPYMDRIIGQSGAGFSLYRHLEGILRLAAGKS